MDGQSPGQELAALFATSMANFLEGFQPALEMAGGLRLRLINDGFTNDAASAIAADMIGMVLSSFKHAQAKQ